MKGLRLQSPSQPPFLAPAESPIPTPREAEVLVKVRAAGVTRSELQWYPTGTAKDGTKRIGAIPSHEFAGTIASMGSGVLGLSIGDPVFGMNDWFAEGALAEDCVTRPEWIAPMPRTLSPVEAAAVPISALTAWQALYGRAGLAAGQRVLIHGGAGAVGTFAIQLAHLRGAYVITTVSPAHSSFVKELGADETIDYRAVPSESVIKGVDVVLDTIGGSTLERSWNVLTQKGNMITIAAGSEGTHDERVKAAFLLVEARRDELEQVSKLIDDRRMRVIVDTVVPLSRAAEAYAGTLPRSGRGKVVVTVE